MDNPAEAANLRHAWQIASKTNERDLNVLALLALGSSAEPLLRGDLDASLSASVQNALGIAFIQKCGREWLRVALGDCNSYSLAVNETSFADVRVSSALLASAIARLWPAQCFHVAAEVFFHGSELAKEMGPIATSNRSRPEIAASARVPLGIPRPSCKHWDDSKGCDRRAVSTGWSTIVT